MHEMKKRLTALIITTLVVVSAWAQQLSVSGVVTDKDTGEPLIGVTVRVAGQTGGTITDFDGRYTVSADQNATLEFTYMGYKKLSERIGGRRQINVQLQSDTQVLDELPAPLHQIFSLHYQEELTIPQIAEIVGVPEGTIKSRLHKTMNIIRKKLKKYENH